MKTLIRTLLCASSIFLNFLQSSAMKKWEAPDLLAEIEPEIPGLPKPRILTQEGRTVGVYYNGKVYPAEEQPEPEPAPRPPSPPPPTPTLPSLPPPPRPLRRRPPLPRQFLESFRPSAIFLRSCFEYFTLENLEFPEGCHLVRSGVVKGATRNGRMFDQNGRPMNRFSNGDILYYGETIFAMYVGDRFKMLDADLRRLIRYSVRGRIP